MILSVLVTIYVAVDFVHEGYIFMSRYLHDLNWRNGVVVEYLNKIFSRAVIGQMFILIHTRMLDHSFEHGS